MGDDWIQSEKVVTGWNWWDPEKEVKKQTVIYKKVYSCGSKDKLQG